MVPEQPDFEAAFSNAAQWSTTNDRFRSCSNNLICDAVWTALLQSQGGCKETNLLAMLGGNSLYMRIELHHKRRCFEPQGIAMQMSAQYEKERGRGERKRERERDGGKQKIERRMRKTVCVFLRLSEQVDFNGQTGRVRQFNAVNPKTTPPSYGDRDGIVLLRQAGRRKRKMRK